MPLLVYLGVRTILSECIEPAGEPKAGGSASTRRLKEYPRGFWDIEPSGYEIGSAEPKVMKRGGRNRVLRRPLSRFVK